METTEDQFNKFYQNIKLTQIQKQDAKDKYTGVCKKLHDYYYPNIEYNGSTKLLIGSYGKHTSIRPARDVDVIFILPNEKFVQYDDNLSNKQSQLLQDIKRILEEKYPNTPISAFGKIVRVEFSETKHNVEVVPAWENQDGSFKLPNSENGGSWHTQSYREEIKAIWDSDKTTGKTKFLIRCIKKWSENCSVNLKSWDIEQMALSFFNTKDGSNSNYSYAILIKQFFDYFLKNTQDEKSVSYLKTAFNRAEKACDFEENQKFDDATEEWRKIFGFDFPNRESKGTKSSIFDERLVFLRDKYPSPVEEFIENYHEINLNPSFVVKIDTYVPDVNGFRANWLSHLIKFSLFNLIKKMSLTFQVVDCNVPKPYQIKWKIRNFGDDAKNNLRGEIILDEGYGQRTEHTAYIGQHYVECYIIKDNKCVAIGHTPVPIG